MALYTKAYLAALVDLINEANPSLPFKIDATNFVYSAPTAITTSDGTGNNTSIRVSAKKASGYRGQITVQYRRLDLSTMFRGQSVAITRYLASGGMDLATLIPLLNDKFGMNFTALATDFTLSGTWTSAQSGTLRNLVAASTNLFWVGTLPVTWTQGLPDLSLDVVKVTTLTGAQWPGGNDFSVDRTKQGEFLLWSLDATDYGATLDSMGTLGGQLYWSSFPSYAQGLASLINSQDSSINAGYTQDSTPDLQLFGKTMQRLSLPATAAQIASFPFLENPKPGYNRVLVLQGTTTKSGDATTYNIPIFYNA